MLATRQGALVLALLCAVCAAGILIFALGQYKTGLKSSTQTVQATVLVATAQIPQGTAGNVVAARGLYKSTPIVAGQLQPGALSDASTLAGKVATTNILPGQQLTAADFSGPTGVTGLLTPDQRALTLTISESPGATDILQAGARVDIYATFGAKMVLLDSNIEVVKPAGATASTSTGSAQPAPAAATGASGSSASSASTTAGSSPATAAPANTTLAGSSMVLAVTARQAADLIFAAQSATLYLTLRPNNASATPAAVTTKDSVIADSIAQVNANPTGAH
jgi:Flp pilus assembly protein CpaB